MVMLPVIRNFHYRKKVKNKLQKGQALLIIVLVMSVAVTIMLSVSSRTITDIRVSESQEDASRAFSAAEAGVEEVIVNLPGSIGTTVADTLPNDSSYITKPEYQNPGSSFIFPGEVLPGESALFWFVEHDSNGNLTCGGGRCFGGNFVRNICWGEIGASVAPAVELSIYYDSTLASIGSNDYSNVRVARTTLDPNLGRTVNNKFSSASTSDCVISGKRFDYSYGSLRFNNSSSPNVDIPCSGTAGCILLITARLLYDYEAPELFPQIAMQLSPGQNFPEQGVKIESTGISGDSTRKVNVLRTFSVPPGIFDSAVFSMGGLTK